MLNLKVQYFGHLMGRVDSLEKALMLGKIESKSRQEWQRIRGLDSIIDSMDMNLIKLQEIVEDRQRSLVYYSPWSNRVRRDLETQQ